MTYVIVDRRKNDKGRSTDNRQRFIRRVKDQIRDAVKDVIRNGSIKDIISDRSKKINIPGKGLQKPTFDHGIGGTNERVYPGNKRFNQGDRQPRPEEGDGLIGDDSEASPDGEGEDDFSFSLTREEFLDFFFQDLELPDLVKKEIVKLDEYVVKRAGYSVDGPPSKLNVLRSMKVAKGRRFALRTSKKKELEELEQTLITMKYELSCFKDPSRTDITETDIVDLTKHIEEIEQRIVVLKRKIKAVPFIDDVDLRYNRWEKVPQPTTQAVMFGIMDVSGSMGEWEKEMSKRFFMLLLLFLTYNYEKVDIVWIKHHTIASEVDEDDFFYSHESGGTLVSPALELASNIIKTRYPPNLYNIFFAQCSDGDDYSEDIPKATKILDSNLLKIARYFAYIEIDQNGGKDSDLWDHYEKLQETNKNLATAVISSIEQIYPVFRSLFEKKK